MDSITIQISQWGKITLFSKNSLEFDIWNNVKIVKNDTLKMRKMRFLWKIGIWNVIFVKNAILVKNWLLKCDFCEKCDYENAILVKNWLLKCDFNGKCDFENAIFWIKCDFLPQLGYCTFFVFTILNFPRFFSVESGPSKVREIQNSVNKKCTISDF